MFNIYFFVTENLLNYSRFSQCPYLYIFERHLCPVIHPISLYVTREPSAISQKASLQYRVMYHA